MSSKDGLERPESMDGLFWLERYDELPHLADFHSPVSVSLGELLTDGVIDWTMPELDWRTEAFDEEQFWRVTSKMEERYFTRDLGVLPIKAWMQLFRSRIRAKMEQLMPAYKAQAEARLMQTTDSYGKRRGVGSTFPATQLKGTTQDYASDAQDSQYEDIVDGDFYDKAIRLSDQWVGLDEQIVRSVDSLFSSLLTVNTNAF